MGMTGKGKGKGEAGGGRLVERWNGFFRRGGGRRLQGFGVLLLVTFWALVRPVDSVGDRYGRWVCRRMDGMLGGWRLGR